jgi:hypothetical protein
MRAIWIGVLSFWLAACGGPRLLMREASEREVAPPPAGRARVVLAVPSAHRDVIGVVDERGAYVGQLGGRTWMTIDVAPGPHRYYALVGASAYVVGGTLEADRTYWIVAETAFGRPMQWVAWAPACGEDTSARIAGARAVEPDPAADRAALDRQLGDVPQRILEADQELQEMTEQRRAARVLAPACAPDAPQGSDAVAPATGDAEPEEEAAEEGLNSGTE